MERHTRFDLVTIGEVLMDLIAPDADILEDAVSFLRVPGGAPANVAVAAARLGARIAFVGAVGNDPFGIVLADVLAREGVDLTGLRRVPERTTLAFVAANHGGIPDFVFYRGSDVALRIDDIPVDLVGDSQFVYVSSMALMSEPSAGATHYATEVARERHRLIAVDPNLRPSSWHSAEELRAAVWPLIRAADVVKVNDQEAVFLTGQSDPSRAARELGDDDTLVIITLGHDGCLWRWSDEQGHVPAPDIEVEDTTGAGDAFMGALLAELAHTGYTPGAHAPLDIEAVRKAVCFATAAGAVACTHTGAMAALPSRAEVDALLRRQ